MLPKEMIRHVSIEFAYWLRNNTIKTYNGYRFNVDFKSGMLDKNEYQEDELYDYWIDAIYLPSIESTTPSND